MKKKLIISLLMVAMCAAVFTGVLAACSNQEEPTIDPDTEWIIDVIREHGYIYYDLFDALYLSPQEVVDTYLNEYAVYTPGNGSAPQFGPKTEDTMFGMSVAVVGNELYLYPTLLEHFKRAAT